MLYSNHNALNSIQSMYGQQPMPLQPMYGQPMYEQLQQPMPVQLQQPMPVQLQHPIQGPLMPVYEELVQSPTNTSGFDQYYEQTHLGTQSGTQSETDSGTQSKTNNDYKYSYIIITEDQDEKKGCEENSNCNLNIEFEELKSKVKALNNAEKKIYVVVKSKNFKETYYKNYNVYENYKNSTSIERNVSENRHTEALKELENACLITYQDICVIISYKNEVEKNNKKLIDFDDTLELLFDVRFKRKRQVIEITQEYITKFIKHLKDSSSSTTINKNLSISSDDDKDYENTPKQYYTQRKVNPTPLGTNSSDFDSIMYTPQYKSSFNANITLSPTKMSLYDDYKTSLTHYSDFIESFKRKFSEKYAKKNIEGRETLNYAGINWEDTSRDFVYKNLTNKIHILPSTLRNTWYDYNITILLLIDEYIYLHGLNISSDYDQFEQTLYEILIKNVRGDGNTHDNGKIHLDKLLNTLRSDANKKEGNINRISRFIRIMKRDIDKIKNDVLSKSTSINSDKWIYFIFPQLINENQNNSLICEYYSLVNNSLLTDKDAGIKEFINNTYLAKNINDILDIIKDWDENTFMSVLRSMRRIDYIWNFLNYIISQNLHITNENFKNNIIILHNKFKDFEYIKQKYIIT